jgi:superfamily II DNA or RNA helicase
MLLLSIDKHYITIHGAMTDDFKKALSNTFSVDVPNFWFAKNQMIKKGQLLQATGNIIDGKAMETKAKNWDGKRGFSYKDGRIIPTGLLNDLLLFLQENNTAYTVHDNRSFLVYDPNPVELIDITLRPYQQQAIDIMAQAGHGILHIAVGGGKTECAAGLIKKLHFPQTLFLTHRNLLSSQTLKRFENRLGIPIGIIEGDFINIQQVTIGMVPTIYNRIKVKNEWFLNYLKSVELVIGDEIHLGTATSWISIFKKIKASNVYGMSGTPFKHHVVDDKKLQATIGPEIFRVPSKWLIDNGYLTPPIVYLVPIKHLNVRGDYNTIYHTNVITNEDRHDLIKQIIDLDPTKQTLILVNLIEHGEILMERLKKYNIALVHSKIKRSIIDDRINKFATREIPLLIATPLLDVGVDIPVIDRLLLCGGSGKAITSILQRIGRSLRISKGKVVAEVYDIVDKDNSYLYEHFVERLSIYTGEDQQFKIKIRDLGNYLDKKECQTT